MQAVLQEYANLYEKTDFGRKDSGSVCARGTDSSIHVRPMICNHFFSFLFIIFHNVVQYSIFSQPRLQIFDDLQGAQPCPLVAQMAVDNIEVLA